MSESSSIKLQALRRPTVLKRDFNTDFFQRNLRNFQEHLVLQTISSGCFCRCKVFLPADLLKRRLRQKHFFCDFCKTFKNIFWQSTTRWLLLVFIWEFWEVSQNTCFIEQVISSYRISTTRYSEKLFHKCFSSILYKKNKQPFEDVKILKDT